LGPGEIRCDELGTSADVRTLGERVERACGDWRSAAVVAIVAWRCGGNDREKPSTPGNAGASAANGVVRRRRHTRPSAVEVKISGFDVVDRSVRIYVRSMVGEPGTGLPGATTRTRYWSPSPAGIGMVGERAVWAGQVVTFDMSGQVWCKSGRLAGISRRRGFAVGGLAGSGGCHTLVTSGTKHGGTQGDTLR
jgi:hypothetical protein